jgi:hypothetical protein
MTEKLEPWRPWMDYSEPEIRDLLETIELAGNILRKGITTRSAEDPLNRLLVRVAQGDAAKRALAALEEGQATALLDKIRDWYELVPLTPKAADWEQLKALLDEHKDPS